MTTQSFRTEQHFKEAIPVCEVSVTGNWCIPGSSFFVAFDPVLVFINRKHVYITCVNTFALWVSEITGAKYLASTHTNAGTEVV